MSNGSGGSILKTIINWILSMLQDDATYLTWAFGLILLASPWCRYYFTILQVFEIWVLREVNNSPNVTQLLSEKGRIWVLVCVTFRAETPKLVAFKPAHQIHLSIYEIPQIIDTHAPGCLIQLLHYRAWEFDF